MSYRIPKRPAPSAEPQSPPLPLPPTNEAKVSKKRGPRSQASRLKMRQRAEARGYIDDLSAKRSHQLDQREAAAKASSERLQRERAQLCAIAARKDAEVKQAHRAKEAALAQARRAERWAQEHVHGEEGEVLSYNQYRVSLRSKMTGFGADPLAATRASIQVEAQQLTRFDVNPAVRALSILDVKTQVWYIGRDGSVVPAVIAAVHSAKPPFYTLAFEEGGERETTRERVVPM